MTGISDHVSVTLSCIVICDFEAFCGGHWEQTILSLQAALGDQLELHDCEMDAMRSKLQKAERRVEK